MTDPLQPPLFDELTFVGIRQDPEGGPNRLAIGGYDRVLLAESQRCAKRAEVAFTSKDNFEEAGASAAAVLCAAAACEARLSEYLVHYEMVSTEPPPWIEEIRKGRDARDQWREVLSRVAPAFEPGSSRQYLALGCLLRLRDGIAHRGARIAAVDTFPPRLEDCVRQQVIPVRVAQGADWTSVVFVHEVGKWAHGAARSWLELAYSLAPLVC